MRELFLRARTEVDPATQDATYGEIAKILNDDVPELSEPKRLAESLAGYLPDPVDDRKQWQIEDD